MIEPKLIKIEAVDDYDVCIAEEAGSHIEPRSGFNQIRTFLRRAKTVPEVGIADRVVRST